MPKFINVYHDAIIKGGEHHYCVSKANSLSSGEDCKKVWEKHDLKYWETELEIVKMENVQLCVRVEEYLYDHEKLWAKARKSNSLLPVGER